MKLAAKCYRNLQEKYPDVNPADPDFDVWMKSGYDENWINNFDVQSQY